MPRSSQPLQPDCGYDVVAEADGTVFRKGSGKVELAENQNWTEAIIRDTSIKACALQRRAMAVLPRYYIDSCA